MITEKKEVYKHRLRAHIYFFRYCSVLKIYKSSPRPTGTAIDWLGGDPQPSGLQLGDIKLAEPASFAGVEDLFVLLDVG